MFSNKTQKNHQYYKSQGLIYTVSNNSASSTLLTLSESQTSTVIDSSTTPQSHTTHNMHRSTHRPRQTERYRVKQTDQLQKCKRTDILLSLIWRRSLSSWTSASFSCTASCTCHSLVRFSCIRLSRFCFVDRSFTTCDLSISVSRFTSSRSVCICAQKEYNTVVVEIMIYSCLLTSSLTNWSQ